LAIILATYMNPMNAIQKGHQCHAPASARTGNKDNAEDFLIPESSSGKDTT
jgi:hypothetical protein